MEGDIAWAVSPKYFYLIGFGVTKGAFCKLREQIAQNVLSCRASSYGFSKYSGNVENSRRNRPTFAVRAQVGLYGTSMSRNCCILYRILRKSHIPTQGSFANILCNLLISIYFDYLAVLRYFSYPRYSLSSEGS